MVKTRIEERFSDFFEKWISKLEEYVQELTEVAKDALPEPEKHKALASKVTSHLKQYYSEKWAMAHDDVLAFFSPVWLTPLENAYSWHTGWKPSMAFKLIEALRKSTRMPGGSLADMTEEQVKKIKALRVKIKWEEDKVEREMERQQVAVADRKMVELSKLASKVRKGEAVEVPVDEAVEAALKRLMVGLEKVMTAADCVRLRTLKGVLDVLNPLQGVDFLAATSNVQIKIRALGKRKMESQSEKVEV